MRQKRKNEFDLIPGIEWEDLPCDRDDSENLGGTILRSIHAAPSSIVEDKLETFIRKEVSNGKNFKNRREARKAFIASRLRQNYKKK